MDLDHIHNALFYSLTRPMSDRGFHPTPEGGGGGMLDSSENPTHLLQHLSHIRREDPQVWAYYLARGQVPRCITGFVTVHHPTW